MKKSKYNFFYDLNCNELIAYNSLTNSMAIISRDDYGKIDKIVNGEFKEEDQTLINDLKRGFFIEDDNFNEIEFLRYKLMTARYGTRSLSLTIAPTMACNFKCIYCYEENHDDWTMMSDEIQESIISFIKEQIRTIQYLSVTWYGGEPLLGIRIIEKLTKKILEICSFNNVEYDASIITNGYLLTPGNISILKKCCISFTQITLDGPKDIHNARRFLKDGGPTFDRIIDNLKILAENIPNIAIRINTDYENKDSVEEIVNLLNSKNIPNNVRPYLGFVDNTNDLYSDNTCLSLAEFASSEDKFINFLKNKREYSSAWRYPSLRANVCGADSCNSFVIDPKGQLYKCWSDIGIERYSVGSLIDGKMKYSRLFEYLFFDPTIDSKCGDCKYLPICMGGCPRKRLDQSDDRCADYEYLLENALVDYANELIKNERR